MCRKRTLPGVPETYRDEAFNTITPIKPTEIRADVVHNVCVGLVTYIDNGTTSFALHKHNFFSIAHHVKLNIFIEQHVRSEVDEHCKAWLQRLVLCCY